MPARFEIHDLLGKRISGGSVDPGVGAATWNCRGVPAGAYLITAFDKRGDLIATARIVKQ
jgi:hypothetical protein